MIKEFFLPTFSMQGDLRAVQLAEKSLDSGIKGVKALTGASTVSAGKGILSGIVEVGKIGKIAGLVGTALTPITEINYSTNLFKDDIELIAKYTPENCTEAVVWATVASVADATTNGFVRSIGNTIPALYQLIPNVDKQWSQTWIDNVNKSVNVKNEYNSIVQPIVNSVKKLK